MVRETLNSNLPLIFPQQKGGGIVKTIQDNMIFTFSCLNEKAKNFILVRDCLPLSYSFQAKVNAL